MLVSTLVRYIAAHHSCEGGVRAASCFHKLQGASIQCFHQTAQHTSIGTSTRTHIHTSYRVASCAYMYSQFPFPTRSRIISWVLVLYLYTLFHVATTWTLLGRVQPPHLRLHVSSILVYTCKIRRIRCATRTASNGIGIGRHPTDALGMALVEL